ncbi:MAG TPA: hypothetical protein VN815_15595 [Steroidobacteraceae bacterium]|nr:hypothetical protein [Steroidobacteraceae bacterium]
MTDEIKSCNAQTAGRAPELPSGARSLIQIIEDRARYYAGNYQPFSDGRNTFVMFADWVASLAQSFPNAALGTAGAVDIVEPKTEAELEAVLNSKDTRSCTVMSDGKVVYQAEEICYCPECGRSHRKMPFGKPPFSSSAALDPATVEACAKADYKIGWWISAALEDPSVCAEMKADINAWFEAHQPGLVMPSPVTSTVRGISPDRTCEHCGGSARIGAEGCPHCQGEGSFDPPVSQTHTTMFKCNCPHEVRGGCSEPKCPHYTKPVSSNVRADK